MVGGAASAVMYYTSNEIHVRKRSTATKAAVLCRVLTFNQGGSFEVPASTEANKVTQARYSLGKSAGDKVHNIYIFFFLLFIFM